MSVRKVWRQYYRNVLDMFLVLKCISSLSHYFYFLQQLFENRIDLHWFSYGKSRYLRRWEILGGNACLLLTVHQNPNSHHQKSIITSMVAKEINGKKYLEIRKWIFCSICIRSTFLECQKSSTTSENYRLRPRYLQFFGKLCFWLLTILTVSRTDPQRPVVWLLSLTEYGWA